MKILCTTAMESEMEVVSKAFSKSGLDDEVVFVISGEGGAAVEATVRPLLERGDFDLLLDFGIAGAFDSKCPIGAKFNVVSERCGEDPDTVLVCSDPLEIEGIPFASGVTFQDMTTDPEIVSRRVAIGADVETMEGSVIFDMAIDFGIRFAQIRTISNTVGEADRTKWDFHKGLRALEEAASACFAVLKAE